MKKIVSLLLAVMMLMSCTAALADTVNFPFTAEECKSFMTDLAATTGVGLEWLGEADTFGYPMQIAQAVSPVREVYVSLHDNNGLFGIELDVFVTEDEMKNDPEYATAIGMYQALAFSAVYLMLNPDTTSDAYLASIQDIQNLLLNLNNIEFNDTMSVMCVTGGMKVRLETAPSDGYMQIMLIIVPEASTVID